MGSVRLYLGRVSNCTAIAPALRTITVAGVHLSTFLNSDTLDSQAINAIFHAHMTVVSGDNVCDLVTICLVELFVCLATSLPGRQAGMLVPQPSPWSLCAA